MRLGLRSHLAFSAATIAQSRREVFFGRRHDEDAYCVGIFSAHLGRALHIDVEQQVFASGLGVAQRLQGGAVVVAEDFGVLEEFIFGDHVLEGGAVGEVIFAALLLGAAGMAGGVGDGEFKVADQRAQLVDERRFAGAGWRRNNKENSRQAFFPQSQSSLKSIRSAEVFGLKLEVLNLFAGLFDFGLHAQTEFGDAGGVSRDAAGLGEQGVGLAIHLLQKEVGLLADLAAGAQQRMKVIDMDAKARNLFIDIAAFDQ